MARWIKKLLGFERQCHEIRAEIETLREGQRSERSQLRQERKVRREINARIAAIEAEYPAIRRK